MAEESKFSSFADMAGELNAEEEAALDEFMD